MKIILYAGMPKCGSSAVQSMLSAEGSFDCKNNKKSKGIVYGAITPGGGFIYGKNLAEKAKVSREKYITSAAAKTLISLADEKKEEIKEKINKLSESYNTLILSREEWGMNPEALKKAFSFLDYSCFSVEIIFFIRPQVQWLNSAWWQWGAWDGNDFETWFDKTVKKINWYRLFSVFSKIEWVDKVNVRVVKGDVVEEFCSLLDIDYIKLEEKNKSLPGCVLRFFQCHPQLRPSAHSSGIEFVLGDRMILPDRPTPWILTPNTISKTLDFFKKSNERLIPHLESSCQIAIFENERWNCVDAYAQFLVEPPEPTDVQKKDLELLLVNAMEAIVEMDGKLRIHGE